MSALARYFRFHGRKVMGYDRTETPLTRQLVEEGIAVHYVDDPSFVPADTEFVVYTPAIPADHQELNYCRQKGYPMKKRSEVLGMITEEAFNICVAGTHGKTTITTMTAHILRHSGYGCNAFLGGIAANYNSNYWSHERKVCVVEADEYDRSFLKLSPDIAVISAMDPDHLDIYGTPEAVDEAFAEFSGRIKAGGLLVHKQGLVKAHMLKAPRIQTYSRTEATAGSYAYGIERMQGGYRFQVKLPDALLENVELPMGGLHNIENITAAITVAHALGIEGEKIKAAVAAFRGVKRRFEYIIAPGTHRDGLVLIDDYAHHPEELRALITGAKNLFPGMKSTVIFQPHLFSRTRDFAEGFAEVLQETDETLLLPIYPARELPVEGVNSEMLLARMNNRKARVLSKTELLSWAATTERNNHLVIMAGAGDIDALVLPVKEQLMN